MHDQNREMRRLERKYGRYLHQQANKLSRNYHERQDLYQIGLIALWRCSLKYKPGPATFLSYASHRIKGDMLRQQQKFQRWERPVDPNEALLEEGGIQ